MNAFAEILEGRAGIPGEARTRRGKRSFLFITSASSDANLNVACLAAFREGASGIRLGRSFRGLLL